METIEGEAIWRDARRHLAETLSKDVYDRWIAVIEFREQTKDTLVLTVANDFYHTWLIENYLPLIRDAVATAAARELAIDFVVDRAGAMQAPADPVDESEAPAPAPRRRRPRGPGPAPPSG